MTIRKRKLYVVMFAVLALCLSAVLVNFQPTTAYAATTISKDTTWGDTEITGSYVINPGVTVTITGKVTIKEGTDATISGGGTIRRGNESAYFNLPGAAYKTNKPTTLTFNNITLDGYKIQAEKSMVENGNPGSALTIKNCTARDWLKVTGNSFGGLVKMYCGTLTIDGSTITGCAGYNRGAIYMTGSSSRSTVVNISNSKFLNNSIVGSSKYTSNYGGAINLEYVTDATITNCEFVNNSSSNGGGGAISVSSSSSLTINSGIFTDNTANLMTDSTFAANGGAVVIWASSIVNVYGGYFLNNKAKGSLSDIYTSSNSTLNVDIKNLPTRVGYTFAGWKDNEGKTYPTTQFTVTGVSTNLVANWEPNAYDIEYKGMDGATLTPKPAQHIYGTDTTINNPTKRGYTFAGWLVNGATTAKKGLILGATEYTDKITLEATWTANVYTINYTDMTGVSLSNRPTKHTFGTATTVGNPTKTGYTFAGWRVNGATTAKKDLTIGATDYAENIKLTPTWTANVYTITYEGLEGANLSPKTTKHTYGTATAISKPTKTGYTFAGWLVNGKTPAVTSLTLGATAYTADITLTATWTANNYTVTYDSNRPATATGTIAGKTKDSTHTYDSDGALTANGYTLTGWTFVGWATSKNGKVVYNDGATVTNLTSTANDKVTLYAVWQANTYKVTYDGNKPGGTVTGATTETTHTYDVASSPANNGFALTGWTFVGWSRTKGATTAEFKPGEKGILNLATEGSVMLYAVWQANIYTVTYDGNKPDGASGNVSGATSNSTHTYDSDGALAANGFVLTGWTFVGWATTSGGTVVYKDGEIVRNLIATDGGIVTLYAVWKANTYNIGFDTAGGSFADPVPVTYDQDVPSVGIPQRKGYIFEGYYSQSGGEGKQYFDKDGKGLCAYTVADDIVLYAAWTPITYTIELYSNGNYVDRVDNVVYGQMRLPAAETLGIVRANYNFVGWNLYDGQNWAMYNADTDYNAGIATVDGEIVVLYAAWAEKPVFTINFDANGGVGAPAMMQAHEDETITLPVAVPTRTDYTFVGWATTADATTAKYMPGDEFTMGSAVVTLYAVWKHNPSLTYNANGGKFEQTVGVTYPAAGTEVVVTDVVPQREGHVFAGWSDSADGAVKYVAGGKFTMPDVDAMLYAVWSKAKYTVTTTVADGYSVIGLGSTYDYGDTAQFTIDGSNPKVYINGVLVQHDNGMYSFVVTGDTDVFVSDGNKFSLVYSANGGVGAPTDKGAYESGDIAEISTTKPTRTGYTFMGWSTSEYAINVDYNSGSVIEFEDADIVLYAVWKANVYSVVYDGNGGDGTMDDSRFSYGTKQKLTANGFTKVGETFVGWALTPTGSVMYGDEAEVADLCTDNDDTITLHAVWQKTVTKICFVSDGGTINAPTSVGYGEQLSADGLVVPTRGGYKFAGYYTQADGAGDMIFDGEMNVVYAVAWDKNVVSMTLYAAWTPVSYTVVYVNGQDEIARQTAVYGVEFNLRLATDELGIVVLAGYTFVGWSTVPGAQTVMFADGQKIVSGLTETDGDEVRLYAVYIKGDTLQAQIDKLNEQTTALKAALDALSDVDKDFETRLTNLAAELKAAQDAIAALDDTYATDAELQAAVDNLTAMLETAQNDLEDKIKKVQENLDKAVDNLQKGIDNNKTYIDDEITAVKNLIEQAKAALKLEFTEADGKLAASIASLETTLNAEDQRLAGLISALETKLSEEVDKLGKEIADNKTELEDSIKTVNDRLTQVDQIIRADFAAEDSKLAASIESLETTLKAEDQRLAGLISDLEAKLDKAVDDLQKGIDDNKTYIDGEITTVKDLIEQVKAALKLEFTEADSKLAESIASLETTLNAEDQRLAGLISDLEAKLDKAVDDLQKGIDDNKTYIDGEIATVKDLIEQAKAALQFEFKEADSKLADSIASLEATLKAEDQRLAGLISDLENKLSEEVERLGKEIADNKTELEDSIKTVNDRLTQVDQVIRADFAAEDSKLAASIESLKTTLNAEDQRLARLISDLENKLDKAVADLESSIAKNKDDLTNEIDAVKTAYAQADSAIRSEMTTINSNLQQSIADLRADCKKADENLDAAIKQVQANLDQAVSDLNKSIAKNKDDLTNEIDAVKTAYAQADNAIKSEMTTINSSLTQSIADLRADCKKADENLDAAIKKVQENLDQAVIDLNKSIADNKADLTNEIDAVKTAYAQADSAIRSEMATINSSLTQSIADLRTDCENADKKLDAAIKKVQANLDQAVADLNKSIDDNKADLTNEIEAVKTAYAQADSALKSEMATINSSLTQSIADLRADCEDADKELDAAIKQVQANLDQAVDNLNKSIAGNKSDIEQKLAAVEASYKAADALINADIASLRATDSKLADRIAALESSSKAADDAIWAGIRQVQANLDDLQKRLDQKDAELEAKLDSIIAEGQIVSSFGMVALYSFVVALITAFVVVVARHVKSKE